MNRVKFVCKWVKIRWTRVWKFVLNIWWEVKGFPTEPCTEGDGNERRSNGLDTREEICGQRGVWMCKSDQYFNLFIVSPRKSGISSFLHLPTQALGRWHLFLQILFIPSLPRRMRGEWAHTTTYNPPGPFHILLYHSNFSIQFSSQVSNTFFSSCGFTLEKRNSRSSSPKRLGLDGKGKPPFGLTKSEPWWIR